MLPLRTPVVPVSFVVSSALGPFSEIHMCMPSRWTHGFRGGGEAGRDSPACFITRLSSDCSLPQALRLMAT